MMVRFARIVAGKAGDRGSAGTPLVVVESQPPSDSSSCSITVVWGSSHTPLDAEYSLVRHTGVPSLCEARDPPWHSYKIAAAFGPFGPMTHAFLFPLTVYLPGEKGAHQGVV